MAKKNRAEVVVQVDAKIQPTVTTTIHRSLLNDDIVNSAVFEKDVITSVTPVGSNEVIDYADRDTATITIAVNTSFSFTSLENGAVKYLEITKVAANTISFAGGTNVTSFQKLINTSFTSVVYAVYNKNGSIYVLALAQTIIEAVESDIDSADASKFTTAKAVSDYISTITSGTKIITLDIGDWNMDSTDFIDKVHGLADYTKVNSISCMIYHDTLPQRVLLNTGSTSGVLEGSIQVLSATTVRLRRTVGGIFDNSFYDATSFNRGVITFELDI